MNSEILSRLFLMKNFMAQKKPFDYEELSNKYWSTEYKGRL
jgi:hypothetical protein